MATASELTVDTTATGMDMAETMFGDGIEVVSASFTGDPNASGVYSGADTTIPGVIGSDSGVILSTGNVADFTNDSGTTDTNTSATTGTDNSGVDSDPDLDGVAGEATFDGAIFEASFIPEGDMLTMQFVFTSEEYPEYVLQGVNDSFGVWVNGEFVELTITTQGRVTVDMVNPGENENLYRDNAADEFNTEMDGITYVLSFKAPVNPGEVNTIKIGIADGGDSVFDSNVLIAADSIQTYALAVEDEVELAANSSRVVDVLANDRDLSDTGLTITRIMGQDVAPGDTITLTTGEQVTLNPDGTLTVTSDGDLGTNILSYQITDGEGNTDIGYVTIRTVDADVMVDGVVSGTAGADLIDAGYLGDPDGDLVDGADATGIHGTQGDEDYILAGAGNDTVLAGADNDFVAGEEGNDSILGGDGDDTLSGGIGDDIAHGDLGDDTIYLGAGNDASGSDGAGGAGNDLIYGGVGDDTVLGGEGDDRLDAGSGDDALYGGSGADTVLGGDGQDAIYVTEASDQDSIDGGEGGPTDFDTVWFGTYATDSGVNVIYTDNEQAGYSYTSDPTSGTFENVEALHLTENDDSVDASATDGPNSFHAQGGDDTVTGGSGAEFIDGGEGDDSLGGNGGSDTLMGGDGADTISGGPEYEIYQEYATVAGDSQTLTGSNGNPDFDHAVTTTGPTVDMLTIPLEGGGSMTGYHVGNGGDANETYTHSFSQEVAGAILTIADIDPTETLVIWLDGVAINLNDAIAAGLVSFDPGTTGFVIDASGALTGTVSPVFEPVPATLTILQPFTTLDVQNASASGDGNGTIYNLVVDTNAPTAYAADDDSIDGGAGDDVLSGGIGADSITGGTGNDSIDAGFDNDAVTGDAGDDTIFGSGGNDTLDGGIGNDDIDGGDDQDSITGGVGNDSLQGGGAEDTLDGGAGDDTLEGGEGNDLLSDTDGPTLADGGEGDDTLIGGDAGDTLSGGAGDDSISAGDGADQLDGGLGADTIDGGAGDDTLTGGADAQVANPNPPEFADVTGPSGTITGTGGNPDFTHDVTSTEVVGEATSTFNLPEGGTETVDGYFVGNSFASEVHTHSFSTDVGSVQLRIADLGTLERLTFYVDGQAIDLNQAMSLGLVSFDAGTTSYYIDGNGNLTAASDAPGPFVPATLTIHGPLQTLGVEFSGTDGSGDGAFYEMSVDSNPAWEVVPDGDDSLSGGEGQDSIDGGTGNDTLLGDAGNDTLTGGAGDDSLSGGADRDTFHGAGGDGVDGGEDGDDFDTLVVNDVANVAYGGGNNEAGVVTFNDGSTLTFQNIETLVVDGVSTNQPDGIVHGTAGNDVIGAGFVDVQGDEIDGADGDNDTVMAGDGNDWVEAGNGNDTVFGGVGGDTLYGGIGSNELHGEEGNDFIWTDNSADTLAGLNDTLFGGTGDDTLYSRYGDDLVYGGEGNDIIHGGPGADTAYGGAGDDQLNGGVDNAADLFHGEAGNDTLRGDGGDDSLYAGADDDLVYGGAGDDLIDAGTGNDTAYGDAGDDAILGGAGEDELVGQTGNDSLDGGDGADFLDGGAGDDTLTGGAGADVMMGQEDADTFYGGAGDFVDGHESVTTGTDNDTLHVSDVLSVVFDTQNPENGVVTFNDGGTLNFYNIENVFVDGVSVTPPDYIVEGTSGNDVIDGSYTGDPEGDEVDSLDAADGSNNDLIEAYGGNDSVIAGAGNDTVFGGTGNDNVEGGTGDDSLIGESGDDLLLGDGGNDLLYGGQGNDTLEGGDGNEAVYGGVGNDSLDGNDGDDTLHGEEGSDVVEAGSGNDVVYGGDGNDYANGREGDDTLDGGAGNDALDGGAGADVMSGGDDRDLFILTTGSGQDTIVGGEGGDDDDILDASAMTDGLDLRMTSDEAGEFGSANGTDGAVFSEIEVIRTGSGDDTLDANATTDGIWIESGDGDDLITGGSGDDRIHGGAGSDTIGAGAGDDLIRLSPDGASDLVVFSDGDGSDTITEWEGPTDNGDGTFTGIDMLDVSSLTDADGNPVNTADVVVSDDGNGNTVLSFPNGEQITLDGVDPATFALDAALVAIGIPPAPDYIVEGTAGNDLINAGYPDDPEGDRVDAGDNASGTNDDLIYGYGGNDTVMALAGNDTIYAGSGNDTVWGDDTVAGDDLIYGDEGDDALHGGLGNDTAYGGTGNDSVNGAEGDDSLTGGDGDDSLRGGTGHDHLDAGAGNDVIDGGSGNDTILGGIGDDTVLAGSGNDVIDVGDGNDYVDASVGNDSLSGGIGDDMLLGNTGNDTMQGGDGADTLGGGADDDLVHGDAGDDLILGDDGNDSLHGGDGNDLVQGGNGEDIATGGLGEDTLHGEGGNDTLDAGSENDCLYGGESDDVLFGGAGEDLLYGGAGNDFLSSGAGADLMEGGDDRDTFIGGIGDVVDGGEGGDDFDTLNLYGQAPDGGSIVVDYDDGNPENGTVFFLDSDGNNVGSMSFTNIENVIVPCFTPGTLIATDRGEVRVENLAPGDRVLTRDAGYQAIRWIGRRDLSAADLAAAPRLNPVRITKGALGLNLPERDLVISPQHRMLMTGTRAELLFGEHEVLVSAAHLTTLAGVAQEAPPGVSYIHLLFDGHEIVRANGAWSESYQPGALTLAGMDDGPRQELLELFPELRLGFLFPSARLALKRHETQLLIAR